MATATAATAQTPRELQLLTTSEKAQFFQQLDAVLGSAGADADADSTNDSAPTLDTCDSTAMVAHEQSSTPGSGQDAPHLPAQQQPEIIVLDSASDSEELVESTRAAHVAHARMLQQRKRTLPDTASPFTDRKRKAPRRNGKHQLHQQGSASSCSTTTGPLHGRNVVIVPIGADVSRKRVDIWNDMVARLGGVVVTVRTSSSSATTARGTSGAAQRLVDWLDVDIVIASAQLERARACAFYNCERAFPPPEATVAGGHCVKVYTPEWLAVVMREKALPVHEHGFEWTRLREQIEAEEAHRDDVAKAQAVAAAAAGGEENDGDSLPGEPESLDDEGSDVRNKGAQEIQRAPPVQLDAPALQRQEDALEEAKAALVRERTPVFFANNPGFQVLADCGQDGKPLKADAFVCQKASMMQANLNAHLTDPLEELMEYLHVERDTWREYMYKKVVSSLKAMRTRVSSVRDLRALSWAKGRLRDKIAEVLETGKIEKLEAKRTNPRLQSLVVLARIWGVGPATAAKLYNMGLKTLDDLRTKGDAVLSEQQKIGLKHYDDFLTKIPRAEVAQIEKTVVDEVRRLLPNATALSCGSYRRGKPSSGDCDVLITDPDKDECTILPELLNRLRARGFITDDLTHVTGHHVGECDTYMGVCQVSTDLPHRRLDIKVYPRRCFGFALLYFTGSDHFNRSMRLLASKKGWSLSDRALKPVTRVNGVKVATGASVVCSSEVDVFIALGMAYRDPRERNCFDMRFLDEDEASAKMRAKASDDA